MPIGKIRATEDYVRIEMRDPDIFIRGTLRTHDIGRVGFSKRIAGRVRKTGEWETQSFLVSRNEPDERAKKLFVQIKDQFRRAEIPLEATQNQMLDKMY